MEIISAGMQNYKVKNLQMCEDSEWKYKFQCAMYSKRREKQKEVN